MSSHFDLVQYTVPETCVMPSDLPDTRESPATVPNGDGTEIGCTSAAPASQPNFGSVGRTPGIPHDKLCLLPWAAWEEGKDYCVTPPVHLSYSVEWKATVSMPNKKNKRTLATDTERDITLELVAYWRHFLNPKLKKLVRNKFTVDGQPRLEDISVVVSVNDRSERDLRKHFDGSKVDWAKLEEQLLKWGEQCRRGRQFRVDLEFHYVDNNAAASGASGKKGRQSATSRMLTELGNETERDRLCGQPIVWRDVYALMRCPGPPCHLGPHCWRDPVGKKHYRILTHQLKRLVLYKEEGNKLESHDDVPDDVRQELYAVEQQRLERQQQPGHQASKSMPPIHITNVMPGQMSPEPSDTLTASREHDTSVRGQGKRVRIVGQRDIAVQEYTAWQRSQVHSEELKSQFDKAESAVLKHGWDLEQIYQSGNLAVMTKEGVLEGIARRYVEDIAEWAEQQGTVVG